ncbi:MAG: fimbrillin family protein [Crenarchaeota archaeon]|nr:fimbrillin family protein [Thermoproteota archaeon]
MRKKLFPILTLAIMLALGACSNEEILQDTNSGTNPGDGRTLTLTASMPDEPTTRVALEQQDDKTIALTWEADDVLQLVFVQGEQGESKIKGTATVTNISDDGKKAQFDIALPDGFDTGKFDLYGVYGGGELTGTIVTLPSNAGNATSLDGTEDTSVQNRKDVMLSFASTNIDATNPNVSVVFNH